MSVFVLKCIAVISMVVDHLAVVLYGRGFPSWNMYLYMRAFGRLAFPLYAFLLVNGFEKTSNRKKYLSRLIMFAAISQVPFTLVFSDINYGEIVSAASLSLNYDPLLYLLFSVCVITAYLVFCSRNLSVLWLCAALVFAQVNLQIGGYECLGWPMSIFYTLSLGFASIWVIDEYIGKRAGLKESLVRAAIVAALVAAFSGRIDYELLGVVLIIALYLCRHDKGAQIAAIVLWCFAYYRFVAVQLFYFSFVSALLLSLYNGKKGGPAKYGAAVKWGFYLIYPAHLLVLGLANILF